MIDVLIKYNNRGIEKNIFTKKDHITVHSFNQRFCFEKNITWFDPGNDCWIYGTTRRYNGLKDDKSKKDLPMAAIMAFFF